MLNPKDELIDMAHRWVEGTSLQDAGIEVLNYLEDGCWTVALDFYGKSCDEAAVQNVLEGMCGLGLQDIHRVDESVIGAAEGLRIYSSTGKYTLQELLNNHKKENGMDEFFSKKKCDRCGASLEDTTRTLSRFNKQVICHACSLDEQKRPDYDKAVRRELEEIKKGNREFEGIGL